MSAPAATIHGPSVAAWQRFSLPTAPEHIRAWLVRDASIPDLVAEQARLRPAKLALVVDGEPMTYQELVERAARFAGWLIAQGIGPSERVLIAGQNSVELLVACLGTMWAGAAEVVAHPTLTARELAHLVDDCRPAAVVCDAELLPRLEEATGGAALVLLRGGGDALPPSLATLLASQSDPAPPPGLKGGEIATLQYTSGTTGAPKGARLTHANLIAYLRSIHLVWEWRASDILVHSLPLAHGHGRNGTYTALLVGATTVILPRTDVDRLIDAIETHEATVLYSVPAIWEKILAHPRCTPEAFRSLRLFTSGSAPLSEATSDRVLEALGERPLERYGATETGLAVSTLLHGPRYPGCVGIQAPGAEVRIADAQGEELDNGEVGEILVRGPAVFDGYWGREATDVITPDGWYRTGDLGMFDPERDNYLAITGRTKEMVITGGLNVYPREVEMIAESADGVAAAAAFGMPSQRWGEQLVIAVVPERPDAFDPDQLLGWMRQRLAGYKVPKECKVVAEIPRNAMGKVLRSELARRWSSL